jgi:hypothetical protein
VLVETDAGPGYLKAMGGSEGLHILACEWVATQLAQWYGLPTFDYAIVSVTEADEIPFHNGGKAQVDPAFITRAESGEPWSGKAKQLRHLVNPQHICRLVVFDTWTLNCDRYSLPAEGTRGKPRINRNNVFLSEEAPRGQLLLKAIDHTHCFTCGRALNRRVKNIDKMKDERVFGLFPEFLDFLQRIHVGQAMSDLKLIDSEVASSMMRTIPREWDVPQSAQEALVELIIGRAAFVAETIEVKLWPQSDVDFEDSEPTE